MDRNEFRVEKLRKLVDDYGGPAEFARLRSQDGADKPIDPTYVSQLLNGHRRFGEKAADNMCRRAGLPEDYFSTDGPAPEPSKVPLPAQENVVEYVVKDAIIDAVVALMRGMSRDGKLVLQGRAEEILLRYPANKQTLSSR